MKWTNLIFTLFFINFNTLAQNLPEVLIPFKSNGNWGYVNTQFEQKIAPIYQEAYPFVGILAKVKKQGKYGFISKTGMEVVPCIYDTATDFYENQAMISLNGEMFTVDNEGNISEFRARCGGTGPIKMDFTEFISISNAGRKGVIRTFPYDTIIVATYKDIKIVDGVEVFVVQDDNDKWGVVNVRNEVLAPLRYSEIEIGQSGNQRFFLTQLNGKFGAINLQGELLAKPEYTSLKCYPNSDLMYTISPNGEVGFIYQGKEYWIR